MKSTLTLLILTIIALANEPNLDHIQPTFDTLPASFLETDLVVSTKTEGNNIFAIEVTPIGGDQSQTIFNDLSGSGFCTIVDSGGIVLRQSGSRFVGEQYQGFTRYRYDRFNNEFYKAEEWATSPWDLYIQEVTELLQNGDFHRARELIRIRGTHSNSSPMSDDELFFELFVKATHREAVRAWRDGRKELAREMVYQLFSDIPTESFNSNDHLDQYRFPVERSELSYNTLPLTEEYHTMMNDFAFFLTKSQNFQLAEILLSQVLVAAPERAVAWLNAGDLYGEPELLDAEDPGPTYYYREYVRLMHEQGNESAIVPRVLKYLE